mgnify:CR=1 FL=1
MDAWMSLLHELVVENTTKIVLLVCDGLGDAPFQGGKTALEAAQKPNLDALARRSALGLADPVGPGITPGSGPGHLALFGYDPLMYRVGRGVLSALGVGLELRSGDIAARGNFATIDPVTGIVTDRRAGRIPTDLCVRLCERLQAEIPSVEDVEVIVRPEKEHRFVLVLRGEDLDPDVTDTDPQREGVPPQEPRPRRPQAERTARILRTWVERARSVLVSETPANMVLLRGLDRRPELPAFPELYRLRAVGLAAYPMYRGLARLVGMDVVACDERAAGAFLEVQRRWDDYDFFFVHFKKTDSFGEDGNFEGKVKALEEVDKALPILLGLNPDVFAVTGDHSTPAVLKGHGWHPVPFLLFSRYERCDSSLTFTERDCARGTLGRFPLRYALAMLLANARRLQKFGA